MKCCVLGGHLRLRDTRGAGSPIRRRTSGAHRLKGDVELAHEELVTGAGAGGAAGTMGAGWSVPTEFDEPDRWRPPLGRW